MSNFLQYPYFLRVGRPSDLEQSNIDSEVEHKYCFWLEALQDGAVISLKMSTGDSIISDIHISISRDSKQTWTAYTGNDIGPLSEGERVYFRAGHPTDSDDFQNVFSQTNHLHFIFNDKRVGAYGNTNCLIKYNGKNAALTSYCFYGLFSGCSSLMYAPELPSTTLVNYCYYNMFSGCTSLTSAPELPAMTLATYCYSYMFYGCSSLESAPALPATTLADYCYQSMFQGCSSLDVSEQLKEGKNEWMIPPNVKTASYWNTNMFAGTGGDFTGNPVPGVKYYIGEEQVEVIPLCFTAEEPNVKISFDSYGEWWDDYNYLEYSTDGNTWNEYTGQEITLASIGDKVYFNTPDGITNYSWGDGEFSFKSTGLFAASGTIMSLAVKDGNTDKIPEGEVNYFSGLFYGNEYLTKAPELPAKTLASGCYASMFQDCSSLTSAPNILPATTLADSCYTNMFRSCSSLTKAPVLPAPSANDTCYGNMFRDCDNLNEIEVSLKTWWSSMSSNHWVRYVAETGTFICPEELPIEYGDGRIPDGWTVTTK